MSQQATSTGVALNAHEGL